MKENIVKEKSYKFAVRIVNLYKYLKEQKEFVLSKQILRCGTSIGSNIEEAIGSYSPKDFLNKITISYKEARETNYWLNLLKDTFYINDQMYISLTKDCEEIIKLITSIQKTTKKKINQSVISNL